MKIKLRTIYAGALGCFSPGETIDLHPDHAIALIDGGYASAIKETKIETATISAPETASNRLTLRKKGR